MTKNNGARSANLKQKVKVSGKESGIFYSQIKKNTFHKIVIHFTVIPALTLVLLWWFMSETGNWKTEVY